MFGTRRSSFLAAYFILFIDIIGFVFVFPLFPSLILDDSSLLLPVKTDAKTRFLLLEVLLTIYPAAQLLGAPLFGLLSDRLGRKRILYWTLTGSIVGNVLTALGVASNFYTLILFSRIVSGFFAANLVICISILADLEATRKKRGKKISYATALLGIGWVIAIIASLLADHFRMLYPFNPSHYFWLMGVLFLVSLLVLSFLFRETAPPEKKHSSKLLHPIFEHIKNRQLLTLYSSLFFWFFGFYLSLQWAPVFLAAKFHSPPEKILWFLAILGTGWALTSLLINPLLLNVFSFWRLNLWGLFFSGLFFFFAAGSGFFLYFTIAFVIGGMFAAGVWSNFISLISLAVPIEQQGACLGIGQSFLSFGQILSPLLGGFAATLHPDAPFYICCLLALVGFLILLIYVVRRKNRLLKYY